MANLSNELLREIATHLPKKGRTSIIQSYHTASTTNNFAGRGVHTFRVAQGMQNNKATTNRVRCVVHPGKNRLDCGLRPESGWFGGPDPLQDMVGNLKRRHGKQYRINFNRNNSPDRSPIYLSNGEVNTNNKEPVGTRYTHTHKVYMTPKGGRPTNLMAVSRAMRNALRAKRRAPKSRSSSRSSSK